MRIEELLGKSADELEALTTEELETYFAPYLNVTRPELVKRETTNNTSITKPSMKKKHMAEQLELNSKMELARQIAAKMGIKL